MKGVSGKKFGKTITVILYGEVFERTFNTQEEADRLYTFVETAVDGDMGDLNILMSEMYYMEKGLLNKEAQNNTLVVTFPSRNESENITARDHERILKGRTVDILKNAKRRYNRKKDKE